MLLTSVAHGDANVSAGAILRKVWQLYATHVCLNPLYTLEMPIRNNAAFESALQKMLSQYQRPHTLSSSPPQSTPPSFTSNVTSAAASDGIDVSDSSFAALSALPDAYEMQ